MKKRLIILFCPLAVAVIICAVVLTPHPTESTAAVSSAPAEKLHFTLSLYGGHPALFDRDDLLEVYDDIPVNSLPPADRTSLEDGIEINSFEELYTLLEDFDG